MSESNQNPNPESNSLAPQFSAELAKLNEQLTAELDKRLAAFAPTVEQTAQHLADLLKLLPEDVRKECPAASSPSERIGWAVAALRSARSERPQVPVTDTHRATVQAPAADHADLSPVARMARGYK